MMMRKTAMVLLAMAAVFLVFAAVNLYGQVFGVHEPGSSYFPDVTVGTPGDEHIGWLAESEVTAGFPDGTYRPDDYVTREEMAIYLARQRAVSTIDTLLLCDLMFGGANWGTLFGTPGGLTQAEEDANQARMLHALGQMVALGYTGEITLPHKRTDWTAWLLP